MLPRVCRLRGIWPLFALGADQVMLDLSQRP